MRHSHALLAVGAMLALGAFACGGEPEIESSASVSDPSVPVEALGEEFLQALLDGDFDAARPLFLDSEDYRVLAGYMSEDPPPQEEVELHLERCQAQFEAVAASLALARSTELIAVVQETPPPQAPWLVDRAALELLVDGEPRTLNLQKVCEVNGRWRLLLGPRWEQ